MGVRIVRIVAASAMLVLVVDVRPAACEGWSLPNPFSSETKSDKKPKKSVTKTVKKEPSVLEKINSSTKAFFRKTGETLGLTKPEPKKVQYASPMPRVVQPPKKESKSWFPSPFASEEPKKPKTVEQWMSDNKRLDP